jgi:hypothetical protein
MYAEIEAPSKVDAETLFFKKHDMLSEIIEIKHRNEIK